MDGPGLPALDLLVLELDGGRLAGRLDLGAAPTAPPVGRRAEPFRTGGRPGDSSFAPLSSTSIRARAWNSMAFATAASTMREAVNTSIQR